MPERVPGNRDAGRHASSLLVHVDPVLLPITLPSAEVVAPDGRAVGPCFPGKEQSLGTLEPGRYAVRATLPGWAAEPASFTQGGSPGSGRIEALLSPTNAYRGRVVDATTGAAVEAYVVTASYRVDAGPEMYRELGERTTFPGGAFHVGGAPIEAGEVRLAVSAEGYVGAATDWLPCDRDTRIEDLVLSLEPDDRPGGEIVGRAASLRGPVDGAQLRALRTDAARGTIARLRVDGQGVHPVGTFAEDAATAPVLAQSDASGAFALSVRPGDYQIVTTAEGCAPSLSAPIAVTPGERVLHDVRLELGATLQGRLVVEPGGWLAVDALRVWISGADVDLEPEVDDEGRFECRGLAPGPYVAEVKTGARDRVAVHPFEVDGPDALELEIPCGASAPGVTLEGSLSMPAGVEGFRWLAGALPAGATSDAAFRSATPDGDGRFEVYGLPRGTLHVLVVGWETAGGAANLGRAARRVVGLATVESGPAAGDPAARARVAVTVEILPTELYITRPSGAADTVDLDVESNALGPGLDLLLSEAARISGLAPGGSVRIGGIPPAGYRLVGPGTSIPFEIPAEWGETNVKVP